MSKRNVATPTLTESRAKRTPKPNPKYAVDYVAKLRISPDRKTEDDDSDTAVASKSIKKVKIAPTPEPKKLAIKTQTPIMSRLSTLRNVPKRGSSPAPTTKTIVVSGKTTPISPKGSPTSVSKTPSVLDKKMSSTSENKAVSSNLETKPGTFLKRITKNESVNVQKVSPMTKTTKKMATDEIRIVNISDIMKQTDTKPPISDDVKSAKKQKIDSEELDIIDIEEEISVSSAIRPTLRQKTPVEKVDTKPKPQVKTTPSPSNIQKQLSPVMGQKRKLTIISPPNLPVKSATTYINKAKPQIIKGSPPFKKQENKEELGQVLAKRILRKVVKPTFTKLKKEESEKPKVRKLINTSKIKKLTTFEKWSILNFPQIQPQPARSVLCLSLTKLGNKIKHIKLPSTDWSYRVTLQKINKENSDKGEVYTGDIEDCGIQEGDKGNYAPVNITFERSNSNNKTPANRSIIFQNKSFSIHMDGKACKLVGAPQYIYDLIEIQTLLQIVDQVDQFHAYVEQGEK